MDKETSILYSRFTDLARQCQTKNRIISTEFLNIYEQTIFQQFARQNTYLQYTLSGGYDLAERKIVCFLPVWEQVEEFTEFPLKVIHIFPKSLKFAQLCTHRDYLGALMNLGLERNRIGDIVVNEKEAFVVCKSEVMHYIKDNITQINHTSVECQESDSDNLFDNFHYQIIEGSVASFRLDCIVTLAFRISRSKTVEALHAEKIFVNGKVLVKPDYLVKEGDVLSFRGKGKCKVVSYGSCTKKGRENITLYKYI